MLSPISFYAATALIGALIGALFSLNMPVEEMEILKGASLSALIITAAIFVSMSVFSILTVRRTAIFFGALISSLVLSLIGIFVINAHLYAVIGIVVGLLYVIVDTQMMIHKAESGRIEPFEDARQLFYDLVQLFLRILSLLLEKEKNEKKKN